MDHPPHQHHNEHSPHHAESMPPSKVPQRPASAVLSTLSNIFVFLVIPVVIALMLTAFFIQSYQVDGESMETTLQDHDRLLVDKAPRTWARLTGHQYVPARGDIIIFNQTGLPDSIYQKQLIKRVVGLPGDRVIVRNGAITIYNSKNPQGFNPDKSGKYKITAPVTNGDVNVLLADNEIFVCGDNRGNSEDSRYFGPVGLNNVVGKLVVRILPLNKTQAF
jgi:signal peptidase I